MMNLGFGQHANCSCGCIAAILNKIGGDHFEVTVRVVTVAFWSLTLLKNLLRANNSSIGQLPAREQRKPSCESKTKLIVLTLESGTLPRFCCSAASRYLSMVAQTQISFGRWLEYLPMGKD